MELSYSLSNDKMYNENSVDERKERERERKKERQKVKNSVKNSMLIYSRLSRGKIDDVAAPSLTFRSTHTACEQ